MKNCEDKSCFIRYHNASLDKHEYCHYLTGRKNIFDSEAQHLSSYATDFITTEQNSLFLLHQNMRSLNKNFFGLESLINQLKLKNSIPSIIGVTETWLSNSQEVQLKKFEILNYTFVHSERSAGRGGGAGLFINDRIKFTLREDIHIKDAESAWIEIQCPRKKSILIGVIYTSGRKREKFVERFNQIMEKINDEKKEVIIMGDMNIDLFKIKTNDYYYHTLLSNGIFNLGSFPTRETVDCKSLIDHFLTNINENTDTISGTILSDISDHHTTYAVFNNFFKNKKDKEKQFAPYKCYSFKNYDSSHTEEKVKDINWDDLYGTDNVQDAYTIILNKLQKNQSELIPVIEIKPKPGLHQPWITEGIRKAQKQRYKLYKKSKSRPNDLIALETYKKYRNKLCSVMRKAEKEFYSTLVEEAEGDQGKMWRVINDVMGRKRKALALPEKLILENGKELDDPQNICDNLNKFFTTVGPSLAAKINDRRKRPEEYLQFQHPLSSFFLQPVSPQEVSTALSKIKVRKTYGPDGLHPRFLRDISTHLARPLAHFINMSFQSGQVPKEIKEARVLPVYKTGEKFKATNYRPISILSILAKVYEGLVYKRLYGYFIEKELLAKEQFGFRKGKSTKGALLRFTHKIQSQLDNKQSVAAVYIDLKKAFDTVDHDILLRKLQHYGIRGTANEWFQSYLKDRKQYIEIGNVRSTFEEVICGVPQGSNLGPLLFLIYVNDLPFCLKYSEATLFADDTTIACCAKNLQELEVKLNQDLDQLKDWFSANKLTLNVGKTYGCIFGIRQKQDNLNLNINGKEIEMSGSVKYLGVHVDSNLSWKFHIANVTNKIGQTLGALSKIRSFLKERALKTIYYSLIHSRLVYCLEVWGTATKTNLQPLIVQQKKAIRLITGSSYLAHTEPLFKRLSIRPFLTEIDYKHALLSVELIKHPGRYDIPLDLNTKHDYLTRFASTSIPLPKKATSRFGLWGLEYKLVKIYNTLPNQVKNLPPTTIKVYKSILKNLFQP